MSENIDRCPVCDMKVKYADYTCQYHKMYFHFCSKQCLDNFNDRPSLYVTRSAKNSGEITKNRVIFLEKPLEIENVDLVKSVLLALMGVNKVVVNTSNIHVGYDLKQVTEAQIENVLSDVDLAIKNNWFDRLRRRLIQQHEENELDNLAAPPRPSYYKASPR